MSYRTLVLERRLNKIENYLLKKFFNIVDILLKKAIINEGQNFRIRYFAKHWKLGVHLIVGTYHFGVNNQWLLSGSRFNMFGLPWYKKTWNIITVRPLFWRYRAMKFRMKIGFVSGETYTKLFGNAEN